MDVCYPRWRCTCRAHQFQLSALEKNRFIVHWASKSKSFKNSADLITLIRDTDKGGSHYVRTVFIEIELDQPFGMLVLDDWFYVANTNGLLRFPYDPGQLQISGRAEKICTLPAGKANRHWTRNIIAKKDGSKIYIAVGSGSNVGEKGAEA